MLKIIRNSSAFFILLALMLSAGAHGGESYVNVPPTVSGEWQDFLRKLPDPHLAPPYPAPDDREGWKKFRKDAEKLWKASSDAVIKRFGATVTAAEKGGVPVVEVRPEHWKDNGKILIYLHGGGYTTGSASSTAGNPAVMAYYTGLRVISIDYTVAPEGTWDKVTDEVIAVLAALEKEGYPPGRTAIWGDSAGGGLAAGAVLKMRDRGLAMPSAAVLWCPWSDITDTGDTYATLEKADPSYTYPRQLKHCADAYARPGDQKNPYVSPVYGDYSKGFPPTLIQGGTKEIFLSNYVRHYQALDQAGIPVKLDLYEGMIHVFMAILPDSPEGKRALKKAAQFIDRYL
ncbi:MAG: alpha/beta hydrolase [Candidatus Eremiobacteraeota bacterium]|nr:alpha/beta hydrolase [Candidatus Eremiobacteraeota bacterium]